MSANNAFGRLLRFWRSTHHQSQETAAIGLGVSTRHISRLETGKVKPSEVLAANICSYFSLNERDTSNLIMAAGYTPSLPIQDIHTPKLKWLRNAARLSIDSASPNAAALIDRYGNLVMVNRAWVGLIHGVLPDETIARHDNFYLLLFEAMRTASEQERQQRTLALVMMAMHQEFLVTQDPQYRLVCDQLMETGLVPDSWAIDAAKVDPMASYKIALNLDGDEIELFLVNQILGATGPASYVSEPRLTLCTLFPAGSTELNERLESHIFSHPLMV